MKARAWIVVLSVMLLAVSAWWWWRPAPPPVRVPALPADAETLRVWKDVDAAAQAEAATAAQQGSVALVPTPATASPAPVVPPAEPPPPEPPSAAGEPTPICATLGPYSEQATAERVRGGIAGTAQGVRVRQDTTAANGFTVFLPSQGSRDAANAAAQKLRDAGFTDLFVIGETGATPNGIALGRFSTQARAETRRAALQLAGFPAQIAPAGEARTRYWVEVRLTGGNAASLRPRAEGASVRAGPCPPG